MTWLDVYAPLNFILHRLVIIIGRARPMCVLCPSGDEWYYRKDEEPVLRAQWKPHST